MFSLIYLQDIQKILNKFVWINKESLIFFIDEEPIYKNFDI